jgi:dipeptidyl aminopeptidase/acylaminoacyl peptidase
VQQLIAGPKRQHWAAEWIGARPDADSLARRLSPMSYVRAGLPPIVITHGDADRSVPYSQSVRLHEALDRVGVPNILITVRGGGHANHGFSDAEMVRIQRETEAFLLAQHVRASGNRAN